MSLTIPPARIVEESASPLLAASEEWVRRPLGDVASVLNGCAFKSTQFTAHGGKPLIRIRDIFGTSTSVGYLGAYDDRYLVRSGDLLVGMDGDFNSARWKGPEALLNQRVCKIVPEAPLLDIEFLTALLPGYLRAIHDVTSSTTVTHLSSRDVAQIPIPVPPLQEQRFIASTIRVVADRRESASRHLAVAHRRVERFQRAVLASACSGRLTTDWREFNPDRGRVTDVLDEIHSARKQRRQKEQPVTLSLPDLPDSYVVATVGQCALSLDYGTSKKCVADPAAGVPVLRMGNIQGGVVDLNDLKYCAVDSEIRKLMLRPGDLLFNRTNSPELVGKSAVYGLDREASFASYLIRLRFDTRVAHPEFVNYWLNSAWGRAWAQLAKTDGVSQSNINGSKLALMPIPLPPLDEQVVIVERASQMLRSAEHLLQRVASASSAVERSSQALLAKAFRGGMSGAMP